MTTSPGPTQIPDDGETVWRELAAAVLRRSHPDVVPATVRPTLTRTTVETLPIPVLGTAGSGQDGYGAGAAAAGPVPLPDRPGWDVRPLVVVTATAGPAARELAGGADSLWLRRPPGVAPGALAAALAGVGLDGLTVALDSDDGAAAADELVAVFAAAGARPGSESVAGVDPLAAAVRSGGPGPGAADVRATVRETVGAADRLGIRALTVDGSAALDAGAGDAGELGWALAVGVALLREMTAAGDSVATALARLEFRLGATVQMYPTIAKLRAARRLWARVGALSGGPQSEMRLHAVTARPMLTRQDPETNLLRTTIAAFAARAGGADAVTVLPYDHALRASGAAARRWARNVGELLTAEAHVGHPVDPGGGAFAIEELTDTLARAAWSEFGRIEAAGGARSALADGSVAARWAATARERARRIADGRQPIVGVTVHPPASAPTPSPGWDDGWPVPQRWEPEPAGAGSLADRDADRNEERS